MEKTAKRETTNRRYDERQWRAFLCSAFLFDASRNRGCLNWRIETTIGYRNFMAGHLIVDQWQTEFFLLTESMRRRSSRTGRTQWLSTADACLSSLSILQQPTQCRSHARAIDRSKQENSLTFCKMKWNQARTESELFLSEASSNEKNNEWIQRCLAKNLWFFFFVRRFLRRRPKTEGSEPIEIFDAFESRMIRNSFWVSEIRRETTKLSTLVTDKTQTSSHSGTSIIIEKDQTNPSPPVDIYFERSGSTAVTMSAFFDFSSLITVLLLMICTTYHIREMRPTIFDHPSLMVGTKIT